jgi:hypothetical protein
VEPVILYGSAKALSGDGSGDGYGDGSGDGYGDGSGDGYGDGSGDGYGYGYGDGDGDGSGDGYGYGYGDGYGSGLKEAILSFAGMLPKKSQSTIRNLLKAGGKLAYWKSDHAGKPCNGGSSDPVDVGTVHEITGDVQLCSRQALHATYNLEKWKGDRIWLVLLSGDIKEDSDKLGARRREIIAELTGGKIRWEH